MYICVLYRWLTRIESLFHLRKRNVLKKSVSKMNIKKTNAMRDTFEGCCMAGSLKQRRIEGGVALGRDGLAAVTTTVEAEDARESSSALAVAVGGVSVGVGRRK